MAELRVLSRASDHLCLRISNGKGFSAVFNTDQLCVACCAGELGPSEPGNKLALRLHRNRGYETHTVEIPFESLEELKKVLVSLRAELLAYPSYFFICMNDVPVLIFSRPHLLTVVAENSDAALHFCDSFYELFEETPDGIAQLQKMMIRDKLPQQQQPARKCESCDQAVAERGGGTHWTDPVLGQRTLCYSCVADSAMQFRASASAALKRGRPK